MRRIDRLPTRLQRSARVRLPGNACSPPSTSEKDPTHAIRARSPGLCQSSPRAPRRAAGARRRRSDAVARRRRGQRDGANRKPTGSGTGPIAGRTEARSGAARPADPVEAQLGEIKKRLNITAAQQPQFDQFASVVKQNAQAMEALMQKAAQSAEKSAVEGLRTAASFAQTEADNLKRLRAGARSALRQPHGPAEAHGRPAVQ